jgi:hypothetical protein
MLLLKIKLDSSHLAFLINGTCCPASNASFNRQTMNQEIIKVAPPSPCLLVQDKRFHSEGCEESNPQRFKIELVMRSVNV